MEVCLTGSVLGGCPEDKISGVEAESNNQKIKKSRLGIFFSTDWDTRGSGERIKHAVHRGDEAKDSCRFLT